jgi:hypothetical protein
VRNSDALKRGVVKLPRVRSFDKCMVLTPIPADGKNLPALGTGSRRNALASK